MMNTLVSSSSQWCAICVQFDDDENDDDDDDDDFESALYIYIYICDA